MDPNHSIKGASDPSAAPSRAVRLPTVDEALQYTAFSSIVPFDADIIPLPSATPTAFSANVLSSDKQARAGQMLARLDTPAKLEQALNNTRNIIEAAKLEVYQFKSTLRHQPPSVVRANADTEPDAQAPPIPLRLSRFASMALRQTGIGFQYPTPISPKGASSARVKDELSSTPQRAPASGIPSSSKSQGQRIITPSSQSVPTSTQDAFPSSQQSISSQPIVQINLSSNVKQPYYNQALDESLVKSQATPVPQRIARVEPHQAIELGRDQREEGNGALGALQDLMLSIFEAEDNLEPDTSGAISVTAEQYFFSSDAVGETGYLLQSAIQGKLYNALSKVISARRFNDVSSEYLIRVERQCHRAFTAASSLTFTIPLDLDESAASDLEARYRVADNSLRAARTVMKIMMGGRDDKQLYSEEILQDLLSCLRHIFDSGLVPVVESRSLSKGQAISESTAAHAVFHHYESLKSTALSLLRRAGATVKAMGELLMQVELSEEAVGTVEALAVQLLFVENAATEKDSVLGISPFEDARRKSMDVLAKVFLRFPEHRKSILTEILSSLEKLPVGRQSARQFKIVNSKPIQVISALIMLLAQISATRPSVVDGGSKVPHSDGDEDDDHGSKINGAGQDIHTIAKPLIDEAHETGRTVIRFILSRALRVSKSSDEPYRNLLDIFTEDFVSVLGHPDWPAAEMLLRLELNMLLSISSSDKTSAPEKSMALELMGSLGSGIADLHSHVVRYSKSVEGSQGALDQCLRRLSSDFIEEGNVDWSLEDKQMLCRAVLHYLPLRDETNLQIQSAQSFVLASAADDLISLPLPDIEDHAGQDLMDQRSIFADWLRSAISDPSTCVTESIFPDVSTTQGLLSWALYVLSTPFCKGLRHIFDAFIRSLKSPQATVKSRALKSVIQLLEKNEQIVHTSNGVIITALRAADDSSPSVRDSALTLLGKCLSIKPSLDAKGYETLLDAASDKSVAVRKKAIKLLKEVYQRNDDKVMRDSIAEAIIGCVADPENSVNELAKMTIEDMWMALFYGAVARTELNATDKRDIRKHAWHLVGTAQIRRDNTTVLEELMDELLNKSGRKLASNRAVAKAIIGQLFDGFIDNTQEAGSPSQSAALQTLKIFAVACPKLFDADQMKMLGPYLQNMQTEEDKIIYRSVVSIYCCVLPILPRLEQKFLADTGDVLRKSLPKLATAELKEVAQCLWIMNSVLNDTPRLANLTKSIVVGIANANGRDLNGDSDAVNSLRTKTQRYIMIVGPCAKFWDLSGQEAIFKPSFPKMKKDQTIAELIVDTLIPFLDQRQPRGIRVQALESVSMICQSWPENFAKPLVVAAFEDVFKSKDVRMEISILEGILEFYKAEEVRSKTGAEIAVGDGSATGAQRLGKSLAVTEHDGAATSLAQRFLSHILRICLASHDSSAWIAVQTIASINRQGLVHPKECAPALVALETSPNALISKTATAEHQDLHQKHESMLGKEYVHAVETAFTYQRDVVKQDSGVKDDSTPKLKAFLEVLKAGTSATRKKLFTDITRKLDFNAAKLTTNLSERIPYTAFVLENFALMEFSRTDDALHLHRCLEKIFIDTGNLLSHTLEPMLESCEARASEVPDDLAIDRESQPLAQAPQQPNVPRHEFQALTVATIILSMLWEARTYIKKAWSLAVTGKQKLAAKDASKQPVKSSSVTAEAFVAKIEQLKEISLHDDFAMLTQCRGFMQALSVDNEHMVSAGDDAEGEEDVEGNEALPGAEGDAADVNKGRKRRRSSYTDGSPSKMPKKRGRPPLGKKKSSKRGTHSGDSDAEGDDDGEDDFV